MGHDGIRSEGSYPKYKAQAAASTTRRTTVFISILSEKKAATAPNQECRPLTYRKMNFQGQPPPNFLRRLEVSELVKPMQRKSLRQAAPRNAGFLVRLESNRRFVEFFDFRKVDI